MTGCVIALGGNLGDPAGAIKSALAVISEHSDISVLQSSRLVESFALTTDGIDKSKPNYLNSVAKLETTLSPHELLAFLNSVEAGFGRVRQERWASRTLDIDIITFGDEQIQTDELVIPHPRAHQRGFVLIPWLDMDPAAELPGKGRVSELAKGMTNEVWFHEAD